MMTITGSHYRTIFVPWLTIHKGWMSLDLLMHALIPPACRVDLPGGSCVVHVYGSRALVQLVW